MVDPLIVVTVTLSLLIFICPRFIWCLIDRRNIRRNRNMNSNADPFVIIVEGEIINDYEYEGFDEDDIRNVSRGIVI
tara:strand:+ start:2722 stop:2952 length:231 start_codon:yes stop_codon:yes gene_type:complete